MRPVWDLVESAIDDGRVIVVREVYREVLEQEDAISDLLKRHRSAVVEPTQEVQRRVGPFAAEFSRLGSLRDRADPFVMAEAAERGAAVVTYEGITFTGAPARGADKKLSAICRRHKIDCTTPRARVARPWPEAVVSTSATRTDPASRPATREPGGSSLSEPAVDVLGNEPQRAILPAEPY